MAFTLISTSIVHLRSTNTVPILISPKYPTTSTVQFHTLNALYLARSLRSEDMTVPERGRQADQVVQLKCIVFPSMGMAC